MTKLINALDRQIEKLAKKRLEELRKELRNESISYGELAELQSLAAYIEPDDVELLEAAGVPEDEDERELRERAAKAQKVADGLEDANIEE